MQRQERKLTSKEKAAKKKRQEEYMTIFVKGKQKRVKRPPKIDGMDVDEFIRINADPIWLHQNEMWEYMGQNEDERQAADMTDAIDAPYKNEKDMVDVNGDIDIPF